MQSAYKPRPVSRRRLQHLALALLAALSACASPSDRITRSLTEAGVPPTSARCVGDRLSKDLSLGQLKRLEDATASLKGRKLTVGELTRRLDRINDPEIISALTSAGINCVVLG